MGFFQDLKQDLSQAVNELAPEEKAKATGDLNATDSLSTDDIFDGGEDSLMGDLEAMLEKEVEALDTTQVETEPAFPEEAVETVPVAEEVAVETKAEDIVIPEEIAQEPVEAPVVNEEVEELLNEVETALEQPEKEIPQVDDGAKEEVLGSVREADISSETAVITEGMTITGDVSGNGSMEVFGCINGNIEILGKLDIVGVVNGNSSASEVYAESAQINGEIKSKGSVKIGQSSVIIGNIEATSAVIAGAVKGDIDVHGPVILDTSAIVMGNIKSKSVQINNGAVIEGMCSQCYAEVSPSSFFNEVKKNRK